MNGDLLLADRVLLAADRVMVTFKHPESVDRAMRFQHGAAACAALRNLRIRVPLGFAGAPLEWQGYKLRFDTSAP